MRYLFDFVGDVFNAEGLQKRDSDYDYFDTGDQEEARQTPLGRYENEITESGYEFGSLAS